MIPWGIPDIEGDTPTANEVHIPQAFIPGKYLRDDHWAPPASG